MSQACAALSDFDFSSDDSSSSQEDEKPKSNKGDCTGLCLIGKSSRNIFDSDMFLCELLSLRMPFATKTSWLARFSVRTRS
jgi:hypothetical protein